MSQQILGTAEDRVLLASDSRVMAWEESGAVARGQVRKLYQLGSHAFICSAGLAVGVDLSQALQREIRAAGVTDFMEIKVMAREFLNREYRRFLLENSRWFQENPEAPRLLYFTLAGYSERLKKCLACVLESKDLALPFTEIDIGPVLTMPRVLKVEARFAHLWSDPSQPLEDLAHFCLQALEKIASRDERVGAPFQVAAVTARGVEFFADFS
ncbi:MAG: hypothetical protein HPY58_02130 [Firmicutes bacterium]|nr:hypothetical protein [Bacillota bacterium]